MRTVFERSAGGIVLTADGRLVLIRTTNLRGRAVVTLPKGLLEMGETAVLAARREVTEETGFDVRAVSDTPAGFVEYWFVRDGVRVYKRVDFFRFTAIGGSPDLHDGEVDEVLVVGAGDAIDTLSYPGERRVVRKALGGWCKTPCTARRSMT